MNSGEERKANCEKRFLVRKKDSAQACTGTRRVVPFPSTGGVDVSLHTLGSANIAEHRRRSHRYAIRPRRSETMNCHYMMRGGAGSSRENKVDRGSKAGRRER
jgi:hypothetical protein